LLQSPFTRHAFRKPRGYAGDAALIDFIYGCVDRADGASTLGETVFSWEFELPGFRSVRYRRMYLAREIDRAAALSTTPRVLSVACGHLREAELSATVRDGRVRLFAVDQDRESLALVDREYSRYGVTSALATVVDMLRRRVDIPPLSLAYAAGLYDYLDDNLASVLTLALFRLLDSGGRLFLSNFTPAHRGAGFMEACMDWRLIHRDESQMLAMTARLPEAEIDAMHQFRDPEGNITYLRIVRR
jgi:hypothetical protein